MSENKIHNKYDPKKEVVLKQIEEKVKKGEMSEKGVWYWGHDKFHCFTDWLKCARDRKSKDGYLSELSNDNDENPCKWEDIEFKYCKDENCKWGKVKWMIIHGFLAYDYHHADCYSKEEMNDEWWKVWSSDEPLTRKIYWTKDWFASQGITWKDFDYMLWVPYAGLEDKIWHLLEEKKGMHRHFLEELKQESEKIAKRKKASSPVENNPNQKAKNTDIESFKNSNFEELISKINIGYKEGVDYKIEVQTEGIRIVEVIDSDLKSVLRKKFSFPFGTNEYLDYHQNKEGQIFYYRTSKESKNDTMVWHEILGNNEAKFHNEPKSCKVCGESSFERDGQMQLWDGDKSSNGLRPNLIAYFHPHCVGKYFAGNQLENHDHNHGKDIVKKGTELKGIEFSDSKSDNNEPVRQDNQKLIINLGSIKRIILTSKGELVIEFSGDGTTPLIQNITSEQISQSQELQKAKDYLQRENKSSISKQEFDKLVISGSSTSPSNESPKNNYGLLIGGGAVVLVLLGIVVGLFISRKKSRKLKK